MKYGKTRWQPALIGALGMGLVACGGAEESQTSPDASGAAPAVGNDTSQADVASDTVDALELHVLNCGTIEVSDLDAFAMSGAYEGVSDTFTNTCWLVRHPQGDFLWDLGLPGLLARSEPQENGIFTVSLEQTLTEQLRAKGLTPEDIERFAISHLHFDHTGQVDQLADPVWLVHANEHAAMFPPVDSDGAVSEQATQFSPFERFETVMFTGEYDVFDDGSVVIFPTPGHTPGHTALQITLPETGPVLLSGDIYHRQESRIAQEVPRFNADVEGVETDPGARTLESMREFEARADRLGAKVIIQHEPADIDPLPAVMR